MNLTDMQRKFILHWGEMGTKWGINRTVAQVHALLFISPEPLNADQITETLSVARSNISTSLRELLGWGIVKIVHRLGDRKDYFEAVKDVWELYRTVLDERKRREIDPTIEMLTECVHEMKGSKRNEQYARDRLADLLSFIETMSGFYESIRSMPPSAIRTIQTGASLGKSMRLAKKKIRKKE